MRPATPYTVSRCHSPARAPCRAASGRRRQRRRRRQAISNRSPARSKTTAATRPPSRRTSTARTPSTAVAPDLIAVVRMWSSSSVRATAEPHAGRLPPGHGSSRVCPKPCARSPWLTVCARSQSSRPSRWSSRDRAGREPVAARLVAREDRRVGQQHLEHRAAPPRPPPPSPLARRRRRARRSARARSRSPGDSLRVRAGGVNQAARAGHTGTRRSGPSPCPGTAYPTYISHTSTGRR